MRLILAAVVRRTKRIFTQVQDPDFARQMPLAEPVMHDDREVLRSLADCAPLLERMVASYGQVTIANLLGVDEASLHRWLSEKGEVDPSMQGRITDLHTVLNRALQVFTPDTTMQWLVGSEPFLGGARPIDVLATRGAARLIEALDGIDAGGYA